MRSVKPLWTESVGGVLLLPPLPARQQLTRVGWAGRTAKLLRISSELQLRSEPAPLTWRGCIRFPADRIHKGVVEALMPGAVEWSDRNELPGERSARRHLFEGGKRDTLRGSIGFRMDADTDAREADGAAALKAHYALWARAFAASPDDPGAGASIAFSQFCDDLGYARLANGSHRPESKRRARTLLARLAGLRVEADYTAPDGRATELRGPVWKIKIDADLSGFTFAPGEWFRDPVWRAFNDRVGLADASLLQLRPDRDAWTIRLAAYLAALARMNGYRSLTLRSETLLSKIGLSHAEARNPARMREKLERALERLEEAGFISGWDWTPTGGAEPDMNAADDLTALIRGGAGRARGVVIHWPAELAARAAGLAARREAHQAPLRSGRRPKAAR